MQIGLKMAYYYLALDAEMRVASIGSGIGMELV